MRGQSYVSLMTDLDGARVLEVKKGRDTQTVVSLWETMSPEQREKIVAAAMDIGGPYIAGTRQAVPHVDIVHDRFHVSKPLNEAVDHTRREEAADHTRREKAAKLAERGDYTLKCSRFMWLHGVVPEKQKDHFEALLETNLRTAREWAYKEPMVEFWYQPARPRARLFSPNGIARS
ncbi:MAG: transposase [Candidatus Synoicihabitans palmerolidicus]|nr:transposase [Candidatus Synoicihabitans palmerolidicus]